MLGLICTLMGPANQIRNRRENPVRTAARGTPAHGHAP
jgi:hypothetical protein